MIAIETFAGTAPREWNDIVSHLGGSIFHTTIWGDYQRHTKGAQLRYLLGRDHNGEAQAAALALLWQSRRPVASLIFRDLELYAHPCARENDAGAVVDLLAHAEDMGRQLGCRRLTLASMMSGDSRFIPSDLGFAETQRLELVADLTRPTDDLWRRVRKDQRERIRRLPREGVSLDIGTTRQDLEGLRDVRETTQGKRQHRGQEYDLPADGQFYDDLFDHLITPGAARLFVARRDNEVMAALFFIEFNGRACSVFSGSSDLGYKLGAQSGLFWFAVETFKAEGLRQLNRGGVPAASQDESHTQHGIYQFKLRLGTTPQLCRSGEKILSPLRDRIFRLRDNLRALAGAH